MREPQLLDEQRDYRIAREAAGGAEGEGAEPVDAKPSGGEDQAIADERKEGEEGDGCAVPAHPGEGAGIGGALRGQAADEVGGHAGGGGLDGGGGGGGAAGPQGQVGEERAFGGKGQQGRGEEAGRGEAEEFRHAKFAASRGRWRRTIIWSGCSRRASTTWRSSRRSSSRRRSPSAWATACSSSARTCSRYSRSSCAAPTTRWPGCRASACSGA